MKSALAIVLASIGAFAVSQSPATAPAARDPLAPLAEFQRQLFERPFSAVLSLESPRTHDGPIFLRIHGRALGHVLVQLDGPARVRGNVALLHEGTTHLWFPRAELHLTVARGDAGGLLAGFDLADLAFPGADLARWRVAEAPAGSTAIRLVPRSARDGDEALELTLAEDGAPALARWLDRRGEPEREVAFEPSERGRFPRRIFVRSLRDPSRDRTLTLRVFERDPPTPAELFLPDALRLWR